MAETNQTNVNKGLLESEFREVLKLYTETILKADSTLPPQNKAVYEAINTLQERLTQHKSDTSNELLAINDALNIAKTLLTNEIATKFELLTKDSSVLDNKIKIEKERLDAFLDGEDIEGTAIDTLKEIQRWIRDDETGTADLINQVGKIEDRVEFLEKEVVLISCGNSKF